MKSKTTLAVVISLFLLIFGISSAQAALTMRVSVDNGTNWTVVEDNGPLDAEPESGSIILMGPLGDWALNTSYSQSQDWPFVGDPATPDIILSVNNVSHNPATMIVQLSASDLTTFPTQTL